VPSAPFGNTPETSQPSLQVAVYQIEASTSDVWPSG